MEIMNGYSWEIFLIPLSVMIISQSIKIVLYSRSGRIAWKEFNRYGGMPSSHTAMFVSLTLIVGMVMGFSSPLFYVTFFMAAAFIRDAVGIRYMLGFHGKMLNKLIAELSDEERKLFPKHLEERLGHTYTEALAGAVVGTVLTIGLHLLAIGTFVV